MKVIFFNIKCINICIMLNDNDKIIQENILKNLKEVIDWATTKPIKLEKCKDYTIRQKREREKENEKKWGNSIIGQINNGQWTTKLGETLVYVVLSILGENPFKPISINGYQPDWESDNYIWEVKTSNWWVDGTAGEKVLGTWIKYQEIPDLYKKPLRIVCLAYQEEEMKNGKTPYFGDNVSEKTRQALDLAKSWGIEYICFSELISSINYE